MIAATKSTKDGGGRGEQAPSTSFSEEPAPNEVSRSDKSRDGKQTQAASDPIQESPLKKAIKDNENSIIQSILSPTSPNNNNDTDGMSFLLDYLFEDGQLTRIEYDLVDKAIGIETPTEQARVLLRILMETKDDEALAVLLEYLRSNRQDPSTSDTILKLSSTFLPAKSKGLHNKYYHTSGRSSPPIGSSLSVSKTGIGIREVIEITRRHSLNSRLNKNGLTAESDHEDRIARVPFRVNLSCGEYGDLRESQHDFYYGRNPIVPSSYKRTEKETDDDDKIKEENVDKSDDEDDEVNEDEEWDWLGYMSLAKIDKLEEPQQNKKEITDFRDFYLTNACLETVRHLILFSCTESLTASSWQRVLKNMNGLLNTDVQPIKDLLLKYQSHSQTKEEQRKGSKTSATSKAARETIQEIVNPSRALHAFQVNWDQIIYHSLQVWKLRNGLNSTFYSLIGLFQHSHLYQTADHLLSHKMSIQARESEKDLEENVIVDEKGNRFSKRLSSSSSSSSTIMLEKSDFLRKFYSPSKRRGSGGVASIGPLSTSKERVSVSPVLSLDLS